ncbi:MAG: FAD-dependent oxidoreductase [Devosiaceae bacterium]|nr:FAD-dependent oxidoreductase [Devosiaceae bacterium MH13]
MTTISSATTQTLTPDVAVIGGGSGGLTTAAVMASFGVPVVLIEKHKMGGDCLNVGCVPSKAILAAAKHAHAITEGEKFGVFAKGTKGKPFDVDFGRVHDHIHEVIGQIEPNDSVERFEGLGVTVLGGEARFTGPNEVQVGNTTVRARRIVVATGSRPAVPPIPGLETVDYLTNEVVFDRTELPDHLIIIGGGPIGLELAQAHRRLGAKVTVLEGFRILGREDREAAELVKQHLTAEGVDLHEFAKVVEVAKDGDGEKAGVRVIVEKGEGDAAERIEISGSHLLVAAGRAVNVEGLDLEKAGIDYDRRGIKVDAGMRTSNTKVYAIGDVAGGLQFTHVAGYHGALISRNILFRLPIKQNATILPKTTYTDPEVASVGATEAELEGRDDIRILRWPFHENDRAIAERTTSGFIKVFTTKRGKILGAVVVGPKAGEIIALWGLAVSKGMKVSDITGWVAAYPTLSEVGRRAAVEYYKGATDNPTLRKVITFLQRFG